ncbi:hypothetical protein HaLaN_12449 [Haematococcus lacustris]|uniref:Uncharacterized protein n=1 Tax=Haematococcus lacustris TaxID=44745 RepID=A0A699ZA40_HAELA|nr:hypothetical protein HaLaN_12449 [Haematococcus lacustris]
MACGRCLWKGCYMTCSGVVSARAWEGLELGIGEAKDSRASVRISVRICVRISVRIPWCNKDGLGRQVWRVPKGTSKGHLQRAPPKGTSKGHLQRAPPKGTSKGHQPCPGPSLCPWWAGWAQLPAQAQCACCAWLAGECWAQALWLLP